MKKTCTKCGETKSVTDFFKDVQKKDNLRSDCKKCCVKACVIYAKGRREINNWKNFKYKTGLTKEQYLELEKAQNGKCAICFKKADRLNLDHCHTTLKIRGLLCNQCNRGLGYFSDSLEKLRSAIAYIENPVIKNLVYKKK